MPAVDALRVRVEAPETVILDGVNAAVRPKDGESVRLTVPLKPFNAAIETVELPEIPARIGKDAGPAVTMKSKTWTLIVAICVRDPLEPVTVAV